MLPFRCLQYYYLAQYFSVHNFSSFSLKKQQQQQQTFQMFFGVYFKLLAVI